GNLNGPPLQKTLAAVVERHQVLHTCFQSLPSGELVLKILHDHRFVIRCIDLSDLVGEQQQQRATQLAQEEASKPFDLGADLMFRATLLKLTPHSHWLLMTLHHIASDGWSQGVMVKEVSSLYRAFSARQVNPLAPLVLQ